MKKITFTQLVKGMTTERLEYLKKIMSRDSIENRINYLEIHRELIDRKIAAINA